MNDKNDLSSLSRHNRDRIHELNILCRQTGLSPPESDELAFLEGLEALNTLKHFEREELHNLLER